MKLLQEGDVIELPRGTCVYATVPEHFLYQNRRGVFDKLAHGQIELDGDFEHMVGRYIVVKTTQEGGCTAMSNDVYPDGHRVFCEHVDDPSMKVDFYQTGCFTCMLPDIVPVGRAERKWTVK